MTPLDDIKANCKAERQPEVSEIPKSQRKFQSYIPSSTNKYGWREDLKYYDLKIPKWKYGFADSIRVICGLVPKQQEKYEPFDPFDPKSYKVENCHQRLHFYQRMLDERGWKDPWIRFEVPMWHKINTTRVYTYWQALGRMLVPGIILGIICAQIKGKYFTYHDYEGREEKWKHFKYAKHH